MKVGIDRVLVKLIPKPTSTTSSNMVDVSSLPQEAEVIEVGIDAEGLLQLLVQKGDIVVLTPESKGIDIYIEKEKHVIIRKHNIELIK